MKTKLCLAVLLMAGAASGHTAPGHFSDFIQKVGMHYLHLVEAHADAKDIKTMTDLIEGYGTSTDVLILRRVLEPVRGLGAEESDMYGPCLDRARIMMESGRPLPFVGCEPKRKDIK